MVIQAIGPLEVDPKGAIPVLCQGPAILHSTHQSGHLDIALRAGSLSWRASALILCLGMYQVACVLLPTSGAVLPLSCDTTHYRRITSLYHHQTLQDNSLSYMRSEIVKTCDKNTSSLDFRSSLGEGLGRA